jgi:hypothetical protein
MALKSQLFNLLNHIEELNLAILRNQNNDESLQKDLIINYLITETLV